MKHFCINHPSKKAVSICHNCGEYYCADCLTEGMNYYYCNKEDCQVEFENDQKPNEETSKTKISKTLKTVYIIISIVIISLAGTVSREFVNKIFSTSEETVIDKPDWGIKHFFYSGLTIEIPFELKQSTLELPTEYRNMIKEMLTYQYSSNPFSMNISYAVYSDEIVPNLDGAAQGAINSIRIAKGVENFSSSITDIFMNGLPGRMISGKYRIHKIQAEFIGVIYTVNSKSWQILCNFITNPENKKVAQRIINSIQVKEYKELSTKLSENIFLKIDYENSHLKLNEPFIVNFVLHTRLNIDSQISVIKLPSFNGLIVKEITPSKKLFFNTVTYNGKQYSAALTKQVSLTAKAKGKYLITPFELEVPVLIDKDYKPVYKYRIKTDSTFINILN